MAEYIPNQPVSFGDINYCDTDEIEYKQLVDNSDETQFQLRIDKCDGAADVMLNGDFATGISDWTVNQGDWYYSSGKLCIDATVATIARYAIQPGQVQNGKYYCVELEIYSISGGGMAIYLGDEVIGTVYSPGSYKFFGYCRVDDPLTPGTFIFYPLTPTVAVCIESVHTYEILRDFVVAVYDIENQYVEEFNFSQNPDLFVFYKDTVTITIPWQQINAENGCYYLCVLDPCKNTNGQNYPARIITCTFLVDDGQWSYPDYTFNVGFISATIPTTGISYMASQQDVFDSFTVDYNVTVNVELTGGVMVDVYFGTNLINTITTTGTHNIIGKAIGTDEIKLVAYTLTTPGTVRFNSVCPTNVIYGNADIENCEFDDGLASWGGQFGEALGTVYAELNSTTPVKELIQEDVFGSLNKEYGIRLRVTVSPGLDAYAEVYFGTKLVATYTNTGSYEIFDYPEGNGDFKIVATLNDMTFDNIAIGVNYVCPIIRSSELTCDFTSNYFKLGDYSNQCTVLINACNNESGLGFEFGPSGFSPRLRLNAKMKQAKYPSEKQSYEDSLGTKKNTSFKRRKAKTLATDAEPEYIHDFLSTLLGYDNVYIDGVLYVSDDTEYNVDWGDMDHYGKVKMLFSEKTQLVSNSNCSDTVIDCRLASNYLLRADDATAFVTQTDGGLIEING